MFFALCSAWRREEPISANGWRVNVDMVASVEKVMVVIAEE